MKPPALVAQHVVTEVPRSADVMCPTCLTLLAAATSVVYASL